VRWLICIALLAALAALSPVLATVSGALVLVGLLTWRLALLF
jgi:hypothetical protein